MCPYLLPQHGYALQELARLSAPRSNLGLGRQLRETGLYFPAQIDYAGDAAGGDLVCLTLSFALVSCPSGTHQYATWAAASLEWGDIFLVNSPTVSSDERLKDEITHEDDDLLDRVGAILFAAFKTKRDIEEQGLNAKIRFGAIAQQIISAIGSDAAERFNFIHQDQ